jgi:two-component system, chemotaxis family, sensor kinase Cph1
MSGFAAGNLGDRWDEVLLEPVHFAGSIQPYGVLLLLSNPELVVLQASANTQDYLGVSPQDLLGQPLSHLMDSAAIALIQQQLNRVAAQNFSQSCLRVRIAERCFDGSLYWAELGFILELELAPEQGSNYVQIPSQVQQAIAKLRRVPDLTDFLQNAALEIRHLTGFDRVMVFQFDAQGAGAVIAEAKRGDLSPYLGLHYPATDIPESVRDLYRQGLMRYIPNLKAPPVALVSGQDPMPPPIDLQFSILRSVDPCCVEYHHNMDVAAILVMALSQGETLWGLISCHHQAPKSVPYEVRESCKLLAQLVASELANKVNTEELSYLLKLRSLQSDFLQSISQAKDLKQALINPAPHLLDLVNAQGAAVCLETDITLVGITPTLEQVRALLHWIDTPSLLPHDLSATPLGSPLLHTHSLPKLYPAAAAFKDCASGLLMLQISRVRQYTILWFRPEVLQTVNWAGDPKTSLNVAADGQVILCPRQSFEQWQEIVQLTSLPWKACELENVLDLRSAIVGLVFEKADELARVNQELECSIRELDSFAYAASHDLKEPLRGIHNYSNLLLKGYSDILDESGKSRLQTLTRLTRRMESLIDALLKFSRLGQTDLHLQPTDLNQILHQVLEDLSISAPDLQTEIRIPHSLPTAHCDPVLMHEVFVNLISNAVKYNDKPEQWVEIGYSSSTPYNTFYVRDNGIGIRERHFNSVFRLFKRLHEQNLYGGGTGAGLTIAKKIIERHRGQLWVESVYGQGSTFYFTLS